MADNEILAHILERLYARLAEVHVEVNHLPETDFEDGFRRAIKDECDFLEQLMSDVEML